MHIAVETNSTCEKFDDADSTTVLDSRSFPAFRLLLEACQGYAKHTGARFFEGTLKDLQCNANEIEATAKLLEFADLVNEFHLRLLERDPDLMSSLKFAYQQVMTECIRNGIKVTCKQLHQWPPNPRPANVLDDDYAWQDMTAPLPEIAQRVFNDDSKRGQNQELRPLQVQAITASFILDFATDVGVHSELSSPNDMHKEQIAEFTLRVDEWAHNNARLENLQQRDGFLENLERLRAEGVAKNFAWGTDLSARPSSKTVGAGLGGMAALGTVASLGGMESLTLLGGTVIFGSGIALGAAGAAAVVGGAYAAKKVLKRSKAGNSAVDRTAEYHDVEIDFDQMD